MARIRRTRYLVVCCHDSLVPDIAALLRGVARLVSVEETYAISVVSGERHVIAPEDVAALLSIPADRWVQADGMDRAALDRLTGMRLVLTDDGDAEQEELLRREEQLRAGEWNLFAALYHFLGRWRDVGADVPLTESDVAAVTGEIAEAVDRFVALHGSAPTALPALPEPPAVHELPLVRRDGGLYGALAARRTARAFDRQATMSVEQVATVLYYVFGCHGYAPMAGDGIIVKRTSPSGGGLHPIEAYPMITGVDGIAPGLYHYNARDHALELVATIAEADADRLAREFLCGQVYFASAQLKIVMTGRFYRSFWKYRHHPKAYAVMMMDAGHLSQTLYLVAAELGLGAFVTGAVNGANIEDRLGLDGTTEGVLAVCGCGVPSRERSPLEPQFRRYVPRFTDLPPETTGPPPTAPTPGPAGTSTAG
jgi:putative peptide maturation dehydrogenase